MVVTGDFRILSVRTWAIVSGNEQSRNERAMLVAEIKRRGYSARVEWIKYSGSTCSTEPFVKTTMGTTYISLK